MPWGHGFRKGQRVLIRSGPFENFDGIVDEVFLRKVRVIIRLFGSLTPVDMPFDGVERI
jgi:transcriptional antiterminator NusG